MTNYERIKLTYYISMIAMSATLILGVSGYLLVNLIRWIL